MKSNIDEVQRQIEVLPKMQEMHTLLQNALDAEGVPHDHASVGYYISDSYISININGRLHAMKGWAKAVSKVLGLNPPVTTRLPFMGAANSAFCKIPEDTWYIRVSPYTSDPSVSLAYVGKKDRPWKDVIIGRFDVPGYLVVGRTKEQEVLTKTQSTVILTGPEELSLCGEESDAEED